VLTFDVYEPPNAPGNRLESAEQLVFVRDGFHWFAAGLPAFWLLVKRMWLEFIVFVGGAGLLVWAFTAAGAPNVGSAILIIAQIVLGFEAGTLYGASLERRGYRFVGTVSGRSAEDCERRMLEVWLPTHTEIPPENPASEPFAPRAQSPGMPTWAQTAFGQAKDQLARGRRLFARTPA
jgi:hypothetical protein